MPHDPPSLFSQPHAAPFVPWSVTSAAAAASIEPSAATLRGVVLDWLRRQGDAGGTDEEIQAGTGLAQNTQRPRRWELVKLFLVSDSGRTRPTRSGRAATVWVATKARQTSLNDAIRAGEIGEEFADA